MNVIKDFENEKNKNAIFLRKVGNSYFYNLEKDICDGIQIIFEHDVKTYGIYLLGNIENMWSDENEICAKRIEISFVPTNFAFVLPYSIFSLEIVCDGKPESIILNLARNKKYEKIWPEFILN